MSFRMIFASAAALAMAAGTPAFAAKNQNQQIAAAESGSGGVKARVTCRSFARTGTRVKREKVCLTRANWKKFEREELEVR